MTFCSCLMLHCLVCVFCLKHIFTTTRLHNTFINLNYIKADIMCMAHFTIDKSLTTYLNSLFSKTKAGMKMHSYHWLFYKPLFKTKTEVRTNRHLFILLLKNKKIYSWFCLKIYNTNGLHIFLQGIWLKTLGSSYVKITLKDQLWAHEKLW